MIKRAVMSYWTEPCRSMPWLGWNNAQDHCLAWQMSSHLLRRHFDDVVLVTDDFGQEYLKPLDLPFTTVRLDLNDLDPALAPYWSLGKLKAYSIQDKPFVHVDTDAFMFKPLPERVLNAPLCVQLPEKFSRGKPPGFYRLDEMLAKVKLPANVRRVATRRIQYAACCGLYGGNDLATIRAHYDLVQECLRVDASGWASLDSFVALLIMEQWMLGVVIQDRRTFVEYLYPTCSGPRGMLDAMQEDTVGFVHLWAERKRNSVNVQRVFDKFCSTTRFLP